MCVCVCVRCVLKANATNRTEAQRQKHNTHTHTHTLHTSTHTPTQQGKNSWGRKCKICFSVFFLLSCRNRNWNFSRLCSRRQDSSLAQLFCCHNINSYNGKATPISKSLGKANYQRGATNMPQKINCFHIYRYISSFSVEPSRGVARLGIVGCANVPKFLYFWKVWAKSESHDKFLCY